MQIIFLAYIVPGTMLLPLFYFWSVHQTAPPGARVLFVYLLVSALLNLGGVILARTGHSNLWLLHIYTMAETVILLQFFHTILHGRRIRLALRIAAIVFVTGCLLDLWLLQSASAFNTYPRAVEAMLFILLSIVYWLNHKEDEHWSSWSANPYNWMVSGLLLYFASAFFLFLFSNFLLTETLSSHNGRIWDLLWATHGVLCMLMYLFFTIGFHQCRHQEKISLS